MTLLLFQNGELFPEVDEFGVPVVCRECMCDKEAVICYDARSTDW